MAIVTVDRPEERTNSTTNGGAVVDRQSPFLHDIQHANTTDGQEWVRSRFFLLAIC